MNTHELDILIKETEKKLFLLNELKESIVFESKAYQLINFSSKTVRNYIRTEFKNTYILYRISDKKEMVSGNIQNIKSYMRLRNIDIKDVYTKKTFKN